MNIYAVLAITALVMTGYKGSKVLLSLLALELGADPFAIGVMMSLYSLFPLILAVVAGRVADRFGFFWPLAGGTFGFAAGIALPGLVPGIPALHASALLIGASFVFFSVTAQSVVGALGTKESRTRDFSLFSLGPAIGAFVGPLGAGVAIDHYGHAHGYLALSLVPLAATIVVLALRARIPRPARRAATPEAAAADLWKSPRLRRMFLVSGVIITAHELFTFYLPIYGHSIGLSATAIGAVVAAYAVAAFAVRIFLPGASRRFSEERVLTWALVLAAGTFALFPLFRSAWVLGAVSFMLGIGLGCGQPLAIILTYNRSPAGRIGEALGMRITVNKLSEMVCPLLFGSLGAAFGAMAVFATNAVLLAGGAWVNRGNRPV